MANARSSRRHLEIPTFEYFDISHRIATEVIMNIVSTVWQLTSYTLFKSAVNDIREYLEFLMAVSTKAGLGFNAIFINNSETSEGVMIEVLVAVEITFVTVLDGNPQ
jgi:hypothetical protein